MPSRAPAWTSGTCQPGCSADTRGRSGAWRRSRRQRAEEDLPGQQRLGEEAHEHVRLLTDEVVLPAADLAVLQDHRDGEHVEGNEQRDEDGDDDDTNPNKYKLKLGKTRVEIDIAKGRLDVKAKRFDLAGFDGSSTVVELHIGDHVGVATVSFENHGDDHEHIHKHDAGH